MSRMIVRTRPPFLFPTFLILLTRNPIATTNLIVLGSDVKGLQTLRVKGNNKKGKGRGQDFFCPSANPNPWQGLGIL